MNKTSTQGTSSLGIRIVGNGAYVTDQLTHLQDFMDLIIFGREQEIRQSYQQ